MSIHNGHRKRVREKFHKSGFVGFHPHEILEFLLFFAQPRGDTNPISHELIRKYGDISSVFDAPYNDLLKVPGISTNTATLLKSIPQFSRVYLESNDKRTILDCTESCGEYLKPKFIGRTTETVIIVFLDNKSAVIKCEVISEGAVNHTHVDLRKIVEVGLNCNAAAAILAHNHPHGTTNPSAQDIKTTASVKSALSIIKIQLLDHIIVADNEYLSMADNNCI